MAAYMLRQRKCEVKVIGEWWVALGEIIDQLISIKQLIELFGPDLPNDGETCGLLIKLRQNIWGIKRGRGASVSFSPTKKNSSWLTDQIDGLL